MRPSTVARAVVAVLGVVLVALGLRDAGGGPAGPMVGVGLGTICLVAAAFERRPAPRVRPGSRDVEGTPRRGTLLVPARARLASLAAMALALALVLGGAALALGGAGGFVLGVLAVACAGAILALLPRVARPETLALVLTPDGFGPVGAAFVRWDEITDLRAVDTEAFRAAAPGLRIARGDGPALRLGSGVSPVEVTELLPVLRRAREDAAARAGLADGTAEALDALR